MLSGCKRTPPLEKIGKMPKKTNEFHESGAAVVPWMNNHSEASGMATQRRELRTLSNNGRHTQQHHCLER